MIASEYFTSLLKYKAWSDSQLHAAVAGLAQDFHASEKHTAMRLLNHIHVVDQIFIANLTGKAHAFTVTNTEATPTIDDLSWAQQETNAWLIDYAQTLDAIDIQKPVAFMFTDGDKGSMSRSEMLTHIIAHGTYHRGAVGRILSARSVAAPRDLFTKFLHESEPSRRS